MTTEKRPPADSEADPASAADPAAVAALCGAVLEALPADPASALDRAVRTRLESYAVGTAVVSRHPCT